MAFPSLRRQKSAYVLSVEEQTLPQQAQKIKKKKKKERTSSIIVYNSKKLNNEQDKY